MIAIAIEAAGAPTKTNSFELAAYSIGFDSDSGSESDEATY